LGRKTFSKNGQRRIPKGEGGGVEAVSTVKTQKKELLECSFRGGLLWNESGSESKYSRQNDGEKIAKTRWDETKKKKCDRKTAHQRVGQTPEVFEIGGSRPAEAIRTKRKRLKH